MIKAEKYLASCGDYGMWRLAKSKTPNRYKIYLECRDGFVLAGEIGRDFSFSSTITNGAALSLIKESGHRLLNLYLEDLKSYAWAREREIMTALGLDQSPVKVAD